MRPLSIVVALFVDAGAPAPTSAPPAPPPRDADAEVIEQLDFLQSLELLRDDDLTLFMEDEEDARDE